MVFIGDSSNIFDNIKSMGKFKIIMALIRDLCVKLFRVVNVTNVDIHGERLRTIFFGKQRASR